MHAQSKKKKKLTAKEHGEYFFWSSFTMGLASTLEVSKGTVGQGK
jgi:hypothetical protein